MLPEEFPDVLLHLGLLEGNLVPFTKALEIFVWSSDSIHAAQQGICPNRRR
jgi:hypothetical protein